MEDDRLSQRTGRARWCAWLVLAGVGARLVLALAPAAPVASASPVETATPAAVPVTRLEWLSACGSRDGLGLYGAEAPACQPAQIVSLTWLQSQAASAGLLAAGEYLGPDAAPACPVQVLSASGRLAGRLCAGAQGLYRLDPAGQPAGSPFRLWISGPDNL